MNFCNSYLYMSISQGHIPIYSESSIVAFHFNTLTLTMLDFAMLGTVIEYFIFSPTAILEPFDTYSRRLMSMYSASSFAVWVHFMLPTYTICSPIWKPHYPVLTIFYCTHFTVGNRRWNKPQTFYYHNLGQIWNPYDLINLGQIWNPYHPAFTIFYTVLIYSREREVPVSTTKSAFY